MIVKRDTYYSSSWWWQQVGFYVQAHILKSKLTKLHNVFHCWNGSKKASDILWPTFQNHWRRSLWKSKRKLCTWCSCSLNHSTIDSVLPNHSAYSQVSSSPIFCKAQQKNCFVVLDRPLLVRAPPQYFFFLFTFFYILL